MKEFIKNKKILFIAPNFFGYEQLIIKKMSELGADVDYYDERPSNDFLTKALIRLNRNLIWKKNDEYYEEIIRKSSQKKYDIVLFIRGEAVSRKKLQKLKTQHKESKFVLYLWDSLSYNPNTRNIKDLFDNIYTFDDEDVNKYDNVKFRPLFYTDDYRKAGEKPLSNIDYDLIFIGTVHTDRYQTLKKIKTNLEEKEVNLFFYFYYPSKLLFWVKKIFDKNFRDAKYSDFQFTGLKTQDIVELYKRSKIVIDIERPKQNGLTIRTLEVLGLGKKLITTNESIKKYDFYNSSNHYVIDRADPKIEDFFINVEYQSLNKIVYEKYSIEKWLEDILT